MVRTLRNLARLLGILRTLAHHDALFMLREPPLSESALFRFLGMLASRGIGVDPQAAAKRRGERLAEALSELGPSFIKLGQSLSIRSDLLGEEIAADLTRLQDNLPPFPIDEVRRILQEEFDRPLETLYSEFEDEPRAAASIAQVHFAVTAADWYEGGDEGGRKVAVKVLRPGVEAAMARDLELFRWVAELLERYVPQTRRLKPRQVIDIVEETINLELDLRFEGAAASELRENFDEHPAFRVPEIDWIRTSQKVMTMERLEGVPAGDLTRLRESGVDMNALLAVSAETFFQQVFRDGFFHADMHPGNLFVEPGGKGTGRPDVLTPVDFGIMGRLDTETRRYLAEMLVGFLTGDYRRVALVHFRAGYVPSTKSVESFTLACRSIGEPIMGRPMHEISLARLLGQLFKVTEQFEMETQPQLLLLQKTMLQAEGMGRLLNPKVNMWELARPLVESWMLENLGPQARLMERAEQTVSTLERLPRLIEKLDRATDTLTDRGLRLHPQTLEGLMTQNEERASLVRRPIAGLYVIVILLAVLVLFSL